MSAEVVRYGLFSCQVCVPADWTDEQTIAFAEAHYPSGTSHGWHLAEDGDETLAGDPSRQPCAEREDYIHRRLDV